MANKYKSCGKCTDGLIIGRGAARICSCMKKYIKMEEYQKRFDSAAIPKKYYNSDLTTYEVLNNSEVNRNSLAVVSQYIQSLSSFLDTGEGLTLVGPNNCGKTHLACSILKQAMWEGHEAYFTLLSGYVDLVTAWWSSHDMDYKDKIDWIKTVDILCLDDVDKTAIMGVDFKEKMFNELLRYREASCLPTILTTNMMDPTSLLNTLGQGIYSLMERCNKRLSFEGSYTAVLQAKIGEKLG